MERAVLALLIAGDQKVIPVDRLVEELWRGEPPEQGAAALRVHLSRLRKLLPEGSLQRRDPGYVLMLGDGRLDAAEFARLAASGRRQMAAGDPQGAAASFSAALDLWRGPAFDGIRPMPMIAAEAVRLNEDRLVVLEDWGEAELAAGRHRDVVARLSVLTDEHPLRERLWQSLILALYRCGRQAEALRAFGRVRSALVEQLGIEPGPELRDMEGAILRQSSELELADSRSLTAVPPKAPVVPSAPTVLELEQLDLPAPLRAPPDAVFVGRERELHALAQAWSAAAAGRRQAVLVSGEPGIGKSRLVAEMANRAHEDGALVLHGHCDDELAMPYQPFVEAISFFVEHSDASLLAGHVAAHGAELALLVPSLSHRLGVLPPPRSADPDAARYLLFASVTALLTTVSQARPVVIVLDDLHWADKPTLALLRYLVTAPEHNRLLVLATYRSSELSKDHALSQLLATMHRFAGVTRLSISGLDHDEILRLVEAFAGHSLDGAGGDLADLLQRETDGNPFFVREVLRHLVESGVVEQAASGQWVTGAALGAVPLPTSVREVIRVRIARLGEIVSQMLSVAAVIGREFEVELLARVSTIAEEDLLDALDRAVEAGVLGEVLDSYGRFRFTHALISHTIYDDLGRTRRALAHRRVGEALEDLYGPNSTAHIRELAQHWTAATQAVDAKKALLYSRMAADASLAALAPDEAVRYYNQALQLHGELAEPDSGIRLDLQIGLGTALRQAGDPTFREVLLEASTFAQELGDRERLVAAVLANSRGFYSSIGVIDRERVAALEAAIAVLETEESADLAALVATLCNELTYGSPLARRRQLADWAKAIAERVDDPATTVGVLNLLELPLQVPETLEERLIDTAKAITLAEGMGDPMLLYWAASFRSIPALQSGDVEEGDRCLEIMDSLTKRLRQPGLDWHSRFRRSSRVHLAGDHAEAERLATEALDIGMESGQPDAFTFYGAQLVGVRWQQGRVGELIPLLAKSAEENPGLPTFTAALALAHSDVDDFTAAAQLLDAAVAGSFEVLPRDVTWVVGIACYAEAAIECAHLEAAAMLFDLLEPWHDQIAYDRTNGAGPVAHYLGGLAVVLGRHDEAERFFEEATEMNARLASPFFGARTDFARSRMLLARGETADRATALRLLERSSAVASRRGYATVERRSRAALVATGDSS
jgi:DNA-binding SARP family transcriptional activator